MRRIIAPALFAVSAILFGVYALLRSDTQVSHSTSPSGSGKSAEHIAIPASTPAEKPVRMPVPEPMPGKGAVITFDNGREVSVVIKQRPPLSSYYYPVEHFVDIYFELEDAAYSGEALAAIQLFEGLKRCKDTPRSKDALDRKLKLARDEGMIEWTSRNRGLEPVPPGFNYSSYESYFQESFTFCEGITGEQIENYLSWARLAVDYGEYWGIRFLTEELGTTQESYSLWQKAWEQGQINAATAPLLRYRDGSTEHLNEQPDYTYTYAFQLIRNKIYAAAEPYSAHGYTERLQAMDEALRATAGFMSAHEQIQAENLAADMLEANSNCCTGNFRWRE